jgi:hypothetical protein
MREILDRLPPDTADRRLEFYPEGYHILTRDVQAETVWRDLDAWLVDPKAPLPSGADGRGTNDDTESGVIVAPSHS